MQFGFLGINYKNAQLDIRDKVAFTDGMKLKFFQCAADAGIEQCMALSTCNRSEVYFCYAGEEKRERIRAIYEAMFPDVELTDYLVGLSGEEAIAYLFRIAAGLESLVLGEDQILGQVKDALDFSRTMGYAGKELNKIVRDAITCAKRIKTEFKISENPLSVSYIGIRKLDELYGLAGKRILVVGSGKTATLALKYIFAYPAVCVTACSRTYAHSKKLREEFPRLDLIPYEAWRSHIGQYDIVVTATASPHLIVKPDNFYPQRKVALLDLAAPRDIDTALAKNPLVQLINLDTLQGIVKENQKERERLVEKSRIWMEEDVKETAAWMLASRMDATIASLQQRCNAIVEDSYAYLNRKMTFNSREQKLLKKALHASLQRLLRDPIHEMKQLDSVEKQEEYQRLVGQLFQLDR